MSDELTATDLKNLVELLDELQASVKVTRTLIIPLQAKLSKMHAAMVAPKPPPS